MKKYLLKLKNRSVALGALAVVVASSAGIGLAATTSDNSPKDIPPQVKAANTSYAANTSKHKSARSSGNLSDSTDSSATDSNQDKTDDSTTKPATTNQSPTPTPSPSPTAVTSAPTITNLSLGQPYFDDNSAPIVTFTVPVTVSGNGNVTITWIQDDGTPICSIAVAFLANQSKEVSCTNSIPTPPQGVWGTATAGSVYAKTTTRVFIGGTSWE